MYCSLGVRIFSVALSLFALNYGVTAVPIDDFYEFRGSLPGQESLGRIDDKFSSPISLTPGFNFFGQIFNTIYVSNNGYLSTREMGNHIPKKLPIENFPLMAIFWADVDTRSIGNVTYRQTNDSTLTEKALGDVQGAYPNTSSIDYLFIATWDNVGYFNNMSDKTNTFQGVLAVSGNQTFVIYYYADGLIQWTREGKALAGYNVGDGIFSYTISLSLKEDIRNIASTSNVGRPGMWVFRVDKEDLFFQGVDIGFKESTYKFSENAGTVEVCLVTAEEDAIYFTVFFNIFFRDEEAIVGEDFNSSVNSAVLKTGHTTVCINLSLSPDTVVEGMESFYLIFMNNNSNIILNGNSFSVQKKIFIKDTTGLDVKFERSLYEVTENARMMELCLERVDNNKIAPNISIDLMIIERSTKPLDGVAFKLPIHRLTFAHDTFRDCITVSIISNSTAHGDRSALLGVERVNSQFMVAAEEATITFLKEKGCPGGDEEWGIIWPNIRAGMVNTQPCLGGIGNATRRCLQNGTWEGANVIDCQSEDITNIVEEASARLPGANEMIENVTRTLVESAVNISVQLAMATERGQETGLFPRDLQSTNNVIAQVLNVFESSVGNPNATNNISTEALLDAFNNILNEANSEGWTQLQTSNVSGSQTLLRNAERYGKYLASTVNGAAEPLMLVRESIMVKAEMVDTTRDVVFPSQPDQLGNFSMKMNENVHITLPADSLIRLASGDSKTELYVVNIIFRNIEKFLPTNTSSLNNSRAQSLVLSSQVGRLDGADLPEDVFRDNPITLEFSFTASSDVVSQYVGVFWKFSDPVGSGGWSSEGVQVIGNETTDNVTRVRCNSTHLTSFAVLVDVAGGLEEVSKEEKVALKIVSYIGCIISAICLSFTVVFFLAMGKKLFSAIHYFVHLNLAISLLLGYVVFVSGIQLGNSNKVVCGLVAALLQYLFLSAFCWMMCEGVMLYLMLIVVFSRLSNKWWFFLILGYCPPLLFVVIGLASRVDHYGAHDKHGNLAYCWLSTDKGTIFAFVVPMVVIIMINIVFLALAVGALICSKNHKAKALDKQKSINKAATILKATVILLPLLGVTWLFGLLTLNSNTTVFAWLFTVFNSLQGAAIFLFHVVRSKPVWNKILYIFKHITTKSSSKYNVSSGQSGSEGQGTTDTLKALLHKKPFDLKESGEYGLSPHHTLTSLADDSVTASEGSVETGVVHTERKA